MTVIVHQESTRKDCAFLLLTQACNLRCTHCYVEAAPTAGPHMPMDVVESALDLLRDLGIEDLRLTGGEPTIHPDLDLIVTKAHAQGFRLGMTSNGTRLLRGHDGRKVLSKLSRCWVSLYGASSANHSDVSGRPERTFHDTIERVGELAGRGCPIGLSVLASPFDVTDVDTLITSSYAAGVRRLRILPMQPDGRGRLLGIDWSAWPDQVRGMARIMQTHPLSSHFDVLTINDPFDIADRFHDGSPSCLLGSRSLLAITPDGWVYPCCFTVYSQAQRLGSVLDRATAARLRARAIVGRPPSPCHGLQPSFWRNAKAQTITCPIGSFDPRTIALHETT